MSIPRPTLCAACTANLWRPTPLGKGRCTHDERDALSPMTRDDIDVPADSLDRAPRVSEVWLAQLHMLGKRLYFAQTRRPRWSLLHRSQDHAAWKVTEPWGGATFDRDGFVSPATGYAVAIRSRNSESRSIPIGQEVGLRIALADFLTRAPYVGVFRDEDKGTVDVDPVAIVGTLVEANALGVYCRSTGGAYSFADGLGYWAPTL